MPSNKNKKQELYFEKGRKVPYDAPVFKVGNKRFTTITDEQGNKSSVQVYGRQYIHGMEFRFLNGDKLPKDAKVKSYNNEHYATVNVNGKEQVIKVKRLAALQQCKNRAKQSARKMTENYLSGMSFFNIQEDESYEPRSVNAKNEMHNFFEVLDIPSEFISMIKVEDEHNQSPPRQSV